MADKLHSDTQERIETLSYTCPLQDSGDLEAGTKTITATSEASGVGSADYNDALTLPKPDDARLTVERIASRLQVTIDSMTAGHLYCRVYVDAQDAKHLLFDEDWDAAEAKLDAVDTLVGTLEPIFDLLGDGLAHTFYFFFWVDSGNAVISVTELWEAVGSCYTGTQREIIRLNMQGIISLFCWGQRVGTGSTTLSLADPSALGLYFATETATVCRLIVASFLCKNDCFAMKGSVATDLNYISSLYINLRSEQ